MRVIALLLVTFLRVCEAQTSDLVTVQWYVWVILGLAVTVGVVVALFSFYCIFIHCRGVLAPRVSEDLQRLMMLQETNKGVSVEVKRDDINVTQQLGEGQFGPIYDAEVRLDVDVLSRALVKVFRSGTAQDLDKFREEVESHLDLQHRNVTKLFGVVSRTPYYALYELPVNGDLKTFLVASSSMNVAELLPKTIQLIAMVADAAAGLEYLQSINFVHSDLAARSCVVTQSLSVKISVYNVGRYLFRNEYSPQPDGSLIPLRWMAPESITTKTFSTVTDIWSFGVLLWEVMTRGSLPHTALTDTEVQDAASQKHLVLPAPSFCSPPIYQIILKCCSYDPKTRPSAEAVHSLLKSRALAEIMAEAENDAHMVQN
ncbi:hypothetical protein EMCRGX_G031029 [Ephydatia muelleri]